MTAAYAFTPFSIITNLFTKKKIGIRFNWFNAVKIILNFVSIQGFLKPRFKPTIIKT